MPRILNSVAIARPLRPVPPRIHTSVIASSVRFGAAW
jgi:hypothetical protein